MVDDDDLSAMADDARPTREELIGQLEQARQKEAKREQSDRRMDLARQKEAVRKHQESVVLGWAAGLALVGWVEYQGVKNNGWRITLTMTGLFVGALAVLVILLKGWAPKLIAVILIAVAVLYVATGRLTP